MQAVRYRRYVGGRALLALTGQSRARWVAVAAAWRNSRAITQHGTGNKEDSPALHYGAGGSITQSRGLGCHAATGSRC
jgi:hypothetical protein